MRVFDLSLREASIGSREDARYLTRSLNNSLNSTVNRPFLDRMLHRPTETYVGDPEHCREMDDSPDDPGVANAWDSGILGGIARAGFSHRESALPDPLNY